jgi:hypothetical protein
MHLENCIRKKKTEKIEDKEKQKKRSCTTKYDWQRPGTQESASLEEGFIKCQDIDEGRATTGQVTKSAG